MHKVTHIKHFGHGHNISKEARQAKLYSITFKVDQANCYKYWVKPISKYACIVRTSHMQQDESIALSQLVQRHAATFMFDDYTTQVLQKCHKN